MLPYAEDLLCALFWLLVYRQLDRLVEQLPTAMAAAHIIVRKTTATALPTMLSWIYRNIYQRLLEAK